MKTTSLCPCGSGASFDTCCDRFIRGEQLAPDAEHLMRSRYSAYALDHRAYLLASWHPDTRPHSLQPDPGEPRAKWIGLEVLRHCTIDETHTEVEFVARYRVGGRAFRLHESSRFDFENGRWYYRDGTLHAS